MAVDIRSLHGLPKPARFLGLMPMNDADSTEVTFELPDAQADAIAAAEEHGIPQALVATTLVKRPSRK